VDRCGQCGFVYDDLPQPEIAVALRELAHQFGPRLDGVDQMRLRHRPRPTTWSALEYAAHVDEVLRVQRERVALALRIDQPRFESMRPDERAAEQRYNERDPTTVADQIRQGADALASLLDGLSVEEWSRGGLYNWPVVAHRDVAWIARHTVHEMVHHLFDIARSTDPTPSSASG
jgi:DNA segregation ATPase FtsK/SpoIIIE, S-DNA-T family